jgi:hypothetical protein
MTNTRAGGQYRFRIVNLMKAKSLYNLGMKPLFYSEADAKKSRPSASASASAASPPGWARRGTDIMYYANAPHPSNGSGGRSRRRQRAAAAAGYTLTFAMDLPNDGDTCYLAHCYPYTYSDLQLYVTLPRCCYFLHYAPRAAACCCCYC